MPQQNSAPQAPVPQRNYASRIPSGFSALSDVWVGDSLAFGNLDKVESEQRGRCFLKEWFNVFPWLIYHCIKKAAFCRICTEFKQLKEHYPYVFKEDAVGFVTGKRPLKSYLIMQQVMPTK